MREIGIREAKSRLSQVLQDVQGGAEWLITHHGKPIARIVPVDQTSLALTHRIKMLEERGVLEPLGETVAAEFLPPLPAGGGVGQRMLQEDRDGGR